MARYLGRFFCTDQPGRHPPRRIAGARDANAGGLGENSKPAVSPDPGFEGQAAVEKPAIDADPEPEEICKLQHDETTGLYSGADQAGNAWHVRRNPDKTLSLMRRAGTGDEDPDQVLLEQPVGAAGELPTATGDRLRRALAPRISDGNGSLDVARLRGIAEVQRQHYARRR